MLDLLDKQILETINRSPTLIRSITEEEIRSGVLSPSVTTIDIKRNLPRNVDIKVIDGRLRALEEDGYIYYEGQRWWLTSKGKEAIGIAVTQPSSGSMRKVLEQTFSQFESEKKPHRETEVAGVSQLEKQINHTRNTLLEITRAAEGEEVFDYEEKMVNIAERLNLIDQRFRDYISTRREELLKEIEELESKIVMKKRELENFEKIIQKE